MRTESPSASSTGYFIEDAYYDGLRRIQERVSEPGVLAEQMNREYVWGPGDSASGGGGFDELLIQFDGDDWSTRNIGWWSLHDASGDLVGFFDLDSNNEARLVAQWSYEPYGDVIAAEHLHPFPAQTLGHKGLFMDRLDNETNAPSSSGDSAHRLVPFAHSVYPHQHPRQGSNLRPEL